MKPCSDAIIAPGFHINAGPLFARMFMVVHAREKLPKKRGGYRITDIRRGFVTPMFGQRNKDRIICYIERRMKAELVKRGSLDTTCFVFFTTRLKFLEQYQMPEGIR
jgi:hypothetical protein